MELSAQIPDITVSRAANAPHYERGENAEMKQQIEDEK